MLHLASFNKVWKLLLKSLEERETTLGELALADTILGSPHASAGTAAFFDCFFLLPELLVVLTTIDRRRWFLLC